MFHVPRFHTSYIPRPPIKSTLSTNAGRGTPRLPALPEEHRAEAVWRQSAAGNGSIVGMLEIYWIYNIYNIYI